MKLLGIIDYGGFRTLAGYQSFVSNKTCWDKQGGWVFIVCQFRLKFHGLSAGVFSGIPSNGKLTRGLHFRNFRRLFERFHQPLPHCN